MITLNGTGAITKWNVNTTNLTVSANTSTIECINSGANAQTFAGGGVITYNNLYITGAGNYTLTITGTNTFHTIYIDRSLAAKTIAGNVTCTISQLVIPRAGTTVVTITNTDFTKASGIFVSDYLTISGSVVTAATFYAGSHSTDSGGNTNWIFTDYANPIVSSLSTSGVNDYSANFNGSLDGLGVYSTVYVYFQYGTSTAYGTNTTEQPLSSVDTFTQPIAGLASGTTYHVRAVGRYKVGSVDTYAYGFDITFKTTSTSGAPVVLTANATDITKNSASLNGSLISVGDFSVGIIAVSFEYGLDTSYGSTTGEEVLSALGSFTASITDLEIEKTYHYRSRARYVVGAISVYAYGSDVTFTTLLVSGSSLYPVITNGAVFSGYLNTGDLLITAESRNTYTGYFPKQDPRKYFQIQLLDPTETTILAATPLTQWGDKPVSIYLNATVAATLSVSDAYVIREIGLGSLSTVYDTYVLQPQDWKGVDLTNLDQWMKSVATNMNEYYSWTGTSYDMLLNVADVGQIISDSGGSYFTTGIPGISAVRPEMFTQSKSQPIITTGVANNVYDRQTWISGESYVLGDKVGYNSVVYECVLGVAGSSTVPPSDATHWSATAESLWEAQVGSTIAADTNIFGNTFGISGQIFIGYIILAVMILIALYGVSRGTGALGMLLISMPFLLVGNYFRVIGIQITVIASVLAIFFFVRQFWFKTT